MAKSPVKIERADKMANQGRGYPSDLFVEDTTSIPFRSVECSCEVSLALYVECVGACRSEAKRHGILPQKTKFYPR